MCVFACVKRHALGRGGDYWQINQTGRRQSAQEEEERGNLLMKEFSLLFCADIKAGTAQSSFFILEFFSSLAEEVNLVFPKSIHCSRWTSKGERSGNCGWQTWRAKKL